MKFLFVVCILAASSGHCFALDREAFTFTKYDLDVRIEPGQQRLAVRGKITLRNDSAIPQKNVSLQISSTLHWRSIHVGDKEVQYVTQPFTSDIDHTGELSEAIVTLPQEIPPKGTVDLEIGYEGVIPLDATRLTRIGVPKKVAEHSDWDTIGNSFTAVRGIGYVAWYPIATGFANLSEGSSLFEAMARWKAREHDTSMRVGLCVEAPVDSDMPILLMNNRSQSDASGGGIGGSEGGPISYCGVHFYQSLVETIPMFAGVWRNDYSDLSRPEFNLLYLQSHKPAADNFALAANLVTPLVTEWFGAPKEKIEVVELADPEATPFESGGMMFTPLNTSDSRLYQLNAVHLLTHAAFPSPQVWIYEGLAHFAQALDLEQQAGRQAALEFMGSHGTSIAETEKKLAADQRDKVVDSDALINTSNEEFYRSKAMFVWWMLRDMVGEEAFKKSLASYRPEQDKEPAYMQHLLEAQSKRDLQWFFDGWVYHDRGLPDFRVVSAYTRPTTGSGYVVTITVENLGDVGAEVPVTVRMESGEITKRLEVHANAKVLIRMDCAATPQDVVLNDGSVPESDTSNNTYKIEIPAAVKRN